MPETVPIKPELLQWAIKRSRLRNEDLIARFPRLPEWRSGERAPTMRQLEDFARKTMTPLGYLFLDEPPDETLPVSDFRTVTDGPVDRPSPNLIETIQSMQRRQAWMRDYLVEEGQQPLEFVGSARNSRNPVTLAGQIRDTLGLNVDWAAGHATWEDALRTLRASIERIGILVASSATVGLNTHRSLDPQEFRGFVLIDDLAPLVFVNAADSKSAQMFTLAHELVHVWLGVAGVFNLVSLQPHPDETERFCNRTAAEFLVPEHKFRERWPQVRDSANPFKAIALSFKVSPLVAARRALDLQFISKAQFFAFYEKDRQEWQRLKEKQRQKQGGPNFYDVQDARLGRRFAYAVVRAAREGRLPFGDAYRLTDLKGNTFNQYANRLVQRMKDEPQ